LVEVGFPQAVLRGGLLASVAPSGVRGPSNEERAAYGIGIRHDTAPLLRRQPAQGAKVQCCWYLLAHRGGRGQSFVYELVFALDGDGSKPMLPGLIAVEELRGCKYDGNLAGVKAGFAGQPSENAGPTRAQSAGVAGGSRRSSSPVSIVVRGSFYENEPKNTIEEQTESAVVVVTPRQTAGAAQWPA
jgi:hypothetical protein